MDPSTTLRPKQLYEQTSQFRHWMFTAEELLERRIKVNEDGIRRMLAAFELETQLAKESGEPVPETPQPQPLTWQEQLDYCRFFERKISDYCAVFRFDKTVQATATIFLKRFYLNHTVMDYDPKSILIACLFLSTKVENSTIPLDDFLAKIPKSPSASTMAELEFVISKGLNFEYAVHHPFWALHGLFLDVQTFIQATQPRTKHADLIKRFYKAFNEATDLVKASLVSDVSLIYMPSQIALAAMMDKTDANGITSVLEAYLEDRFQTEPKERRDGLQARIAEIRECLNSIDKLEVDKAAAGAISSKLKTCMNLEMDVNSRVYSKRAHDAEVQASEKRRRKAEQQRTNQQQYASSVM
eukprot:jgi/Hompol1/502/HPOL_005332-RA